MGPSPAASVSAGHYHSCAVTTGGAAKCWGRNGYGQLGDGTTTNHSTHVPVSGLTGVVAIAAGPYPSLALPSGDHVLQFVGIHGRLFGLLRRRFARFLGRFRLLLFFGLRFHLRGTLAKHASQRGL